MRHFEPQILVFFSPRGFSTSNVKACLWCMFILSWCPWRLAKLLLMYTLVPFGMLALIKVMKIKSQVGSSLLKKKKKFQKKYGLLLFGTIILLSQSICVTWRPLPTCCNEPRPPIMLWTTLGLHMSMWIWSKLSVPRSNQPYRWHCLFLLVHLSIKTNSYWCSSPMTNTWCYTTTLVFLQSYLKLVK